MSQSLREGHCRPRWEAPSGGCREPGPSQRRWVVLATPGLLLLWSGHCWLPCGPQGSDPGGARLCPANFSAAADLVLSGFQEDFLWPVLVAAFLVAVAGNGLALHRFRTREPRPWNPAVVFSAQLAVSDLLYALTLPPLAAYLYPPKNWRYGAAACLLERFAFTCNLLGSVAFITCISLTRYLGIVHPFFTRARLRPRHAWVLSAAGWALAVLLAAPTLAFSRLKGPPGAPRCSRAQPEACTKCLGTAADEQLEAYRAYSLALAALGGGLPLLLTLLAYGALARAVLGSPSMAGAEKRRVLALVASGVALYAGSYVPYHITRVLNVDARRRWLSRCPDFANATQAVTALELGPYLGFQVMRALTPLAVCVHPLLYMAVAPSLRCCPRRPSPGPDVPLQAATTPRAPAPSPRSCAPEAAGSGEQG